MVFNLTDDEINKIVGEYGPELLDKTLDILKCCTNKEEPCETCPLSDFQQCATICDIMALKVIVGLLEERDTLRRLLSMAKQDMLWLIMDRKASREQLNHNGLSALFFLNEKINAVSVDADFGRICDYLEKIENDSTNN